MHTGGGERGKIEHAPQVADTPNDCFVTMIFIPPFAMRLYVSHASRQRVLGVIAVLCSVLYVAARLHHGWVPHDAGQIGHTAERVLGGELQHRDFDEPYTGALGSLHALAFLLFGIRVESMRWVLLAYFSIYIACVYWLSVRVIPPWVASLVTLLCACVSVSIYPESMPSWYILFFTTFGTLALLQHAETGNRRWIFWAGCCAGCCVLMKINGLYFVAACLLYFVVAEQTASSGRSGRAIGYSTLVTLACGVFVSLGLVFARGARPWAGAVHFTLPLVAITAYVVWHEWTLPGRIGGERARHLARQVVPFSIGAISVWGVFLLPYVMTGALPELYRGLFVLPAARLQYAAAPPPALSWMCLSLPLGALLGAGIFRQAKQLASPLVACAFIVSLVALFALSATVPGYFYLFQALRNTIPVVVLVGVYSLFLSRPVRGHPEVYLTLAVAALGNLIQYPYAYGTYFFYAAPLMIVAAVYVVASQSYAPRLLHVVLLSFALVIAVVRLPQPDPRLLNGFYRPDLPVAEMNLSRCQLVVYREDARVYGELIALVQSLTLPEEAIYAAPDCPEIYFLAARRNPTRTFYDLFDQSEESRQHRVLDLLRRTPINVVVVNHMPGFSPRIDRETLEALRQMYPHTRLFRGCRKPGQPAVDLFTVYWREPRVGMSANVAGDPQAAVSVARDRASRVGCVGGDGSPRLASECGVSGEL